jgi:hypothetical protein
MWHAAARREIRRGAPGSAAAKFTSGLGLPQEDGRTEHPVPATATAVGQQWAGDGRAT